MIPKRKVMFSVCLPADVLAVLRAESISRTESMGSVLRRWVRERIVGGLHGAAGESSGGVSETSGRESGLTDGVERSAVGDVAVSHETAAANTPIAKASGRRAKASV